MSVIPFPSILEPRFKASNGVMQERTSFGWEAITDQDAMNINHALRVRADQHERDGENGLARLYRQYMEQLTAAWQSTQGQLEASL